jgi:hypothetical protein
MLEYALFYFYTFNALMINTCNYNIYVQNVGILIPILIYVKTSQIVSTGLMTRFFPYFLFPAKMGVSLLWI